MTRLLLRLVLSRLPPSYVVALLAALHCMLFDAEHITDRFFVLDPRYECCFLREYARLSGPADRF